MKTILVTGGAGFIGSHLCEALLAQGNKVICVDNLMTGSRENVAHLKLTFIEHDVIEPLDLEVDEIYNLACPASPKGYQADPIHTLRTSVWGAYHMLELARKNGARLLQASTSEVYGDPEVHPQPESYWGNVNPVGPRACYDDKTEILTEDGWTPFPLLKPETKVATLNQKGIAEYHAPYEIIHQRYKGKMLRFANRKFDFCVTPNHQLYAKSKTGKMKFLRADENRHWRSWRIVTGATFTGKEIGVKSFGRPPAHAKVALPDMEMDTWLELFGYYVAEGCVHVREREKEVGGSSYAVHDYNVLIAQEDIVGWAHIDACLSVSGLKYYSSDDHQFRISSKQLAEALAPLGKSGDKFLPREYLGLTPRQSRILLDSLLLGDGSVRGAAACYYTKSRRLADDVQELALRCGYASSLSPVKGRSLYAVNIRQPADARLVQPEELGYDGEVHCVNVKNHVVCVRRNGKAAWCGNCYDEGKRAAETLCMDYVRKHGLSVRIARIFNTYGPRMHPDDGRVVSTFIRQALAGEPLTVFGDGTQTRSFCYVDDTVRGLIALMASDAEGPVNVGNPDEHTVKAIAERVLRLTGSKSALALRPLPEDDPKKRRPDIARAKSLGWSPRVELDDGLKLTIAWMRTRGSSS